jgi:hypothetical protein
MSRLTCGLFAAKQQDGISCTLPLKLRKIPPKKLSSTIGKLITNLPFNVVMLAPSQQLEEIGSFNRKPEADV